jgi:hypothetical protein
MRVIVFRTYFILEQGALLFSTEITNWNKPLPINEINLIVFLCSYFEEVKFQTTYLTCKIKSSNSSLCILMHRLVLTVVNNIFTSSLSKNRCRGGEKK